MDFQDVSILEAYPHSGVSIKGNTRRAMSTMFGLSVRYGSPYAASSTGGHCTVISQRYENVFDCSPACYSPRSINANPPRPCCRLHVRVRIRPVHRRFMHTGLGYSTRLRGCSTSVQHLSVAPEYLHQQHWHLNLAVVAPFHQTTFPERHAVVVHR